MTVVSRGEADETLPFADGCLESGMLVWTTARLANAYH